MTGLMHLLTDALEMPRFLLGRRRIGIGPCDNSPFRLISAGEREFNRHHLRGGLVPDLVLGDLNEKLLAGRCRLQDFVG